MAANPPEHSLHGGPRRIVELAARALGFAAGQATLLEDDGRQVVVTVGPVGDEDERVFDQVADAVLAQRLVEMTTRQVWLYWTATDRSWGRSPSWVAGPNRGPGAPTSKRCSVPLPTCSATSST